MRDRGNEFYIRSNSRKSFRSGADELRGDDCVGSLVGRVGRSGKLLGHRERSILDVVLRTSERVEKNWSLEFRIVRSTFLDDDELSGSEELREKRVDSESQQKMCEIEREKEFRDSHR